VTLWLAHDDEEEEWNACFALFCLIKREIFSAAKATSEAQNSALLTNGDDWNPQFLPCAGQQVERGVRRSRLGDRSKKSPKCDVVGTVLLSFDGTVQLIVTGNPDNLPRSQAAARFRERSILAP
jgi:hypothetical protein